MEQLTEEKLIQQARRGDQDAICQLYENTKNYTWFIASRYLKNGEDIADALQETYISAFSKLHTFEDGKSFKTWIHAIVVNKCLDFLKKKKVMQISTGEIAELVNEDEDIIPALWIERAEKRRDIIRIIDALPEGQRMAISLFYIEGLPVSEIAAIMSVTEGSVKTHLSRGRQAIKEAVLLEEKKGNKLYGIVAIPLLTQLFELEAEAAVMPEEMSKIVWEGTLRGLAAAGGPGANQPGGSDTCGQNVHNSGTGGVASATVKTSMTLATKIIIGVVTAVMITAGVFVIPGLIGTQGPTQAEFDRAVAENAVLKERIAELAEPDELDTHDITMSSWEDQATGYIYTFIEDNTVAVTTSDGALIETGSYFIEGRKLRLEVFGAESLFDFETGDDRLTLAYQRGTTVFNSIPRIGGIPSHEGHGDIADFVGVWAEATGNIYTFYDNKTATISDGVYTEWGTYDVYANSISLVFHGFDFNGLKAMRFELDGDELVLTLQGHQTHLSRTGRADTPVATPNVTANIGSPVWLVEPMLDYDGVNYNHIFKFTAGFDGEWCELDTRTGAVRSILPPVGGYLEYNPYKYGHLLWRHEGEVDYAPFGDLIIFGFDNDELVASNFIEISSDYPDRVFAIVQFTYDEAYYGKSIWEVLTDGYVNGYGERVSYDAVSFGKYALAVNGNLITDFIYEDAIGADGIGFVSYDHEKYAIVDTSGRILTDFIYKYPGHALVKGYAAVSTGDKAGFVDLKGNELIPFIFEDTLVIDENTAFVKYNGKYGIIDVKETAAAMSAR